MEKLVRQPRILDMSSDDFRRRYHYFGSDLGSVYTPRATRFRIWAPSATQVWVVLYEKGDGQEEGRSFSMQASEKGTWFVKLVGDFAGVYYTFRVQVNGRLQEAVDPYAKACGVNGRRGMVVDLPRTNPPGWEMIGRCEHRQFADAIIYEMHIRDISIHPDSGVHWKGKFLGLTERHTQNSDGVYTGLEHIIELGVTHVHLLPSFDFISVDESLSQGNQYNWGYDPQNYNIPEGWYATNPYAGEVRIREFKQMVMALKQAGLGVIMDVVYNHTARGKDSHLNQLVPGYYYRTWPGGQLSNGSGCGNELASERSMVRKMIVDSLVYWAREYKIDGFRFDLMGLHDIATINEARSRLNEISRGVILYGEGWTGGDSPLPQHLRAVKHHMQQLPGTAAFHDDFRDAVKGHVFDHGQTGFISGAQGMEESIKAGVVGAGPHQQVDYGQVLYSDAPWAGEPAQAVNYAEAHDNLTLWDKLSVSRSDSTESEREAMHKLAGAILLTSQGIPFLQLGMDFLRSKGGDSNSYRSPDSVNAICWSRKTKYETVFQYYKGLIYLRKAHPAFRLTRIEQVQRHLEFLTMPAQRMVGYLLKSHAGGDQWNLIAVVLNAQTTKQTVRLPLANWVQVVNGNKAGTSCLAEVTDYEVQIDPISCNVFVDRDSFHRPVAGRNSAEKVG